MRYPALQIGGRLEERSTVNDKFLGSHESHERTEILKTSSDRGFGLVFAAVCAIIAAFGLYYQTSHWPYWITAAALFLTAALVRPQILGPLNGLWTKLGLLLFAVVSPVVLAIVFYLWIWPIGLIIRICGKDLLRLQYEPDASTYWIDRDQTRPNSTTMKNQF